MGYTNYIETEKAQISKTAFEKIKKDVKEIEQYLKNEGIVTLYDGLGENEGVVYGDNYLAFNGKDDEGHETFFIDIDEDCTFNFCKTARKPYDIAVCMAMLSISKHSDEGVEISTDGTNEEWAEPVKHFNMLFGTNIIIDVSRNISVSF